MTLFGKVNTSTQLQRSVILTIDDFRKGVSAPSDVTIGTTPTISALQFNSVSEIVSLKALMPIDWDKSLNVSLDLAFSLVNAQTNNDELAITVDYTAIKKNTTGAGIAKTSTQILATLNVTTANGLAADDLYIMNIIEDGGDATNPYSVGDDVIGLALEFHLTNTDEVAEINFSGGCINYTALY